MQYQWVGTMPRKNKHADGSRMTMWTKQHELGESVVMRAGRKFCAFFAFDDGLNFTQERKFSTLEEAKSYAEQYESCQ